MRWTFFLLLLLNVAILKGQHHYESYTPSNGLQDARVNRIMQMKDGRLIFLTRDGFSIYDGQRFNNYQHLNGKEIGIIDDGILLQDSTALLFTFDGLAIRIKNKTVNFDTLLSNKVIEPSIIHSFEQGQLIISNKGFYLFRNNQIKPISQAKDSLAIKNIDNSVVVGNAFIVFNKMQGPINKLYLYDIQRQALLDSMVLSSKAYCIKSSENGTILISLDNGLYQVDYASIFTGHLRLGNPWLSAYLPKGFLSTNIYFDKANNIWVMNSTIGAWKINLTSGEKRLYSTNEGLEEGLVGVYQDKENNYWFMINGKGVQKLLQNNLETIRDLGNKRMPLVNFLYNLNEDSVVCGANQSFVLKNTALALTSKLSPSLYSTSFYWNKDWWVFKDFNVLANSSGKQIRFDYVKQRVPSRFNISPHLKYDLEGNLIVGGNQIVVLKKDGHAAALALPYYTDNIVVDDVNRYWSFSRSDDITAYEWKDEGLQQVEGLRIDGLAARYVMHWNADTFWVATRNKGIQILTVQNGQAKLVGNINKAKGLSNDFAEVLLRVNSDKVAVGTASGLDIITLSAMDTLIENVSSPINNYQPFISLVKNGQNELLAITENLELLQLTISPVLKNDFKPIAYFDEITVNGKIIPETQTAFSYYENNWKFQLAAPSFIDNRNIQFKFYLEGNRQMWTQFSNRAVFEIINLMPGRYHLKVIVSYPGKFYPDQILDFEFLIDQPIWKTTWFIILVIVSTISLLVWIIRSYFKQLLLKKAAALEKEQAVEKERTRIATDMHDDFGAALSRIKFLSEKIQLNRTEKDTIQADLQKISFYSDEMADKMGEIVWALNQRYDSIGDLVSFSRAYASEFLQDKHIVLHFSAEGMSERKIHGEWRRNIFLVIKESLHNIVKHSQATEVWLLFDEKQLLQVTIRDNGIGIDTAHIRPFANGLENMKKRVAGIGGQIEIKRENGTVIHISVPI